MLIYFIWAALLLDLLLGDPLTWPHPVVFMGWVINRGTGLIRRYFISPRSLRWGGIILVVMVVGGTYGATWGLLQLLAKVHPYLSYGVEIGLLYTALAAKSLQQHAQAVACPLVKGDLATARQKVSLIVGRDTGHLNQQEITRAVVETVAENTVDGIIAPLFYAFIGGAPLALAYKAVNTLDSMVGYKEAPFRDLGWAAAKFDDMVNYLPARVAGLLLLLLAPCTPGGGRGVWQSMHRDAKKHPSPNGGIIEAGVAGALGIQLGGLNYYFGQPSYRAVMGPMGQPLASRHIKQVLVIMYALTLLAMMLGSWLRWKGVYN